MLLARHGRAADVAKIIKGTNGQESVGIVLFAIAALTARLAQFGLDGGVGELGGDVATGIAQVALIGIDGADIVQIVGENAPAAQFHIDAPAVGQVDFKPDPINEGGLDGAVFLSAQLAFSALFAQFVPGVVKFCLGVEIKSPRSGKHIRRVEVVAVPVDVGHEVEFKLQSCIGHEAAEMQVSPLFHDVFGVGIVGRDAAGVDAEPQREPVVEIVTRPCAARQGDAIEPPVGVQVAKIIGSAYPSTRFPAAHLGKSALCTTGEHTQEDTKFTLIHSIVNVLIKNVLMC